MKRIGDVLFGSFALAVASALVLLVVLFIFVGPGVIEVLFEPWSALIFGVLVAAWFPFVRRRLK